MLGTEVTLCLSLALCLVQKDLTKWRYIELNGGNWLEQETYVWEDELSVHDKSLADLISCHQEHQSHEIERREDARLRLEAEPLSGEGCLSVLRNLSLIELRLAVCVLELLSQVNACLRKVVLDVCLAYRS